MKVGREFNFDSAHYLPNHEKCGCVHGHTWTISIELEGDTINGMVVDFYIMRKETEKILNELDHRLLNDVKGLEYPTVENLCTHITKKTQDWLPFNIHHITITIREGSGGWATFTRPNLRSYITEGI